MLRLPQLSPVSGGVENSREITEWLTQNTPILEQLNAAQDTPAAKRALEDIRQLGYSSLLPPALFAAGREIADCITAGGRGFFSGVTATLSVMLRDGVHFPRIIIAKHKATKMITVVRWHTIRQEIINDDPNSTILGWAEDIGSTLRPCPTTTQAGVRDIAHVLSAISPLLYFLWEEGHRGTDYLPNLQGGEAYLFVDESEQVASDGLVAYELIAAVARPNQSALRLEVSMLGQPPGHAIRQLIGDLLRPIC
ncbi:MAG: hypothetical protein WC400_00975 [Patescibacteria group bacterium]|jgi:hypothetical protein